MAKHQAERTSHASEPRPRVVIVDDHATIAQHVARVLENDFTVAASFRDAESLLAGWVGTRADVIVLDLSLPDHNGFEAASRLRTEGCAVPIVFLSVYEASEIVTAAWAFGGLAYVAKRLLGSDLVPAIRSALAGRRFVSPALAP